MVNILIVVVCAGQFREIVLGLPVDVTVNMRPQLKAIICLRKIPLFHTFRKKEIYSQHFLKNINIIIYMLTGFLSHLFIKSNGSSPTWA